MKLICELMDDNLVESNVIEESDGQKNLYIEGIYMQAGITNKNGRIYSPEIMKAAIDKYRTEKIDQKCAYGELNHPATPVINLERASHLITEIRQDGNNFIGKSRVLPTTMGNVVRGILEGGGRVAVSSRGVGTLVRKGMIMEVQSDFRLATAADIVSDPSAPDAFVQAIMEGCDWVFNEGVGWEAVSIAETVKQSLDRSAKSLTEEKRMKAFEVFIKHIQNVKI